MRGSDGKDCSILGTVALEFSQPRIWHMIARIQWLPIQNYFLADNVRLMSQPIGNIIHHLPSNFRSTYAVPRRSQMHFNVRWMSAALANTRTSRIHPIRGCTGLSRIGQLRSSLTVRTSTIGSRRCSASLL